MRGRLRLFRLSRQLLNGPRSDLLDLGDKPVTPSRDGLDKLRSFPAVAQCLSDLGNVIGEVPFLDESICPEHLHQTVFLEQVSCILNKQTKRLKSLRCQRNDLPVAQQPMLRRIKVVSVEL